MREATRVGIWAIAAALLLSPSVVRAQESPTQNGAASSNAVGPRELEGFSLNGTVTRQADPQPAPPDAPRRQGPADRAPPPDAVRQPAAAVARSETPRPRPAQPAVQPPEERPAPAAAPAPSGFAPAPAPAPVPAFSPPPALPSAAPAEDSPSLVPWLLALLAAALGAAFVFWRQRSQRALATPGGPGLAFAGRDPVPEPRPAPPPAPAPAPPPPAAPAAPAGVVSTRLRPWIDIEFVPIRCVVEEDRAVIEFEAGMFNSGSAPARDVLLELGIYNAGPEQDEQIARFQAKPPGDGRRVPLIEPLRRVRQAHHIAVSLDKLRVFEAAGRRFFVPMIVLNAYYSWGGGEGKSAVSYLVGREGGETDKMTPFRLDLGPRVFRGLGAREHHLKVRV